MAAKTTAAELGINSSHERLAAFHNGEVASNIARSYFDDFFGWMNSEDFDDAGNVIKTRQARWAPGTSLHTPVIDRSPFDLI